MTTITIPRAVVEQALHVAENAGYPLALIKALRAALAQQAESGRPVEEPDDEVCDGSRGGLCIHQDPNQCKPERDCPAFSALPQRPAAVEDPDGYDDGLTWFRVEALHRRIT